MKNLNRHVIWKYATSWRDIGIALGLDLNILNIIREDYPQQFVICFRRTLEAWLHTNNATWQALEVALTNVNRTMVLDGDVYGKDVY